MSSAIVCNRAAIYIIWYNPMESANAARYIRVILKHSTHCGSLGARVVWVLGGKCNFLNAELYNTKIHEKALKFTSLLVRTIKAKESERYTISFPFDAQHFNQSNGRRKDFCTSLTAEECLSTQQSIQNEVSGKIKFQHERDCEQSEKLLKEQLSWSKWQSENARRRINKTKGLERTER